VRDFVPVAAVNYSDTVMLVHTSVPAKDLKEFIALAKMEPGKLNYASPWKSFSKSATVRAGW
jgi:tripartite-type tricarboxylate transporter receptor subunit TctC